MVRISSKCMKSADQWLEFNYSARCALTQVKTKNQRKIYFSNLFQYSNLNEVESPNSQVTLTYLASNPIHPSSPNAEISKSLLEVDLTVASRSRNFINVAL